MEEPNIDMFTEDSEMNDPINTGDDDTDEFIDDVDDFADNLDGSLRFAPDIDLEDDDAVENTGDESLDDANDEPSDDSDDEPLDDSDDSESEPIDDNDENDDAGAGDASDDIGDNDGNGGADDNDNDDNMGDDESDDSGDDNNESGSGENETPSDDDVTQLTAELNVGPVTAYGIARKNGFVGTELDWLRMLRDKISPSEKGVAGGVATLDMNGLIPTNQIPGAYDDVIDGFYDSDTDKFYKDVEKTIEVLGESGKIYVDITGAPIQYRYGGATFVRITTNEVTSMTDEDIYEILSM